MSKFNRNTNKARRVPAIEVRYRRILANLRQVRRNGTKNKQLEVDICHQIKFIDDYIAFFPNHYVHDEVVQLEAMVNQLASEQQAA